MRRASGINPFIFIPKLVDSNREYISYGFGTIYSLPCKLNLDLKFLISFHENIILFLFLFLFLFFFLFILSNILFYFYFIFILFYFYYFILFYFFLFLFFIYLFYFILFFLLKGMCINIFKIFKFY